MCGVFVSMNEIIADDINNVGSDVYVMTHTTNSLLSATTIQTAMKAFAEESGKTNSDSLFTVNKA
jgi:CMP-N-acetylneuraminic acid synthetase